MYTLIADPLKLALCLWTSSGEWPEEVEALRNSLCADAPDHFSDEQLQEEAASVISTFRKLNTSSGERPLKRQKMEEPGSRSVYDFLIMTVNGSGPDSPTLDLHGIHDSIR